VIYDHVILVLKGVSLTVPKAASWRCWGQRRGQDDDAEGDFQPAAAERGEVTKGSIEFEGRSVVRALTPNDLVRAAASR
jgi:branched-chain amino acid transport system ATP-binding protein